jgi:hypothetical protein
MKQPQDMYERLFRAARRIREDDTVPYAFEKRIMAHITPVESMDSGSFWALGLWKASVPCLALMLCTTLWASMNGSAGQPGEEALVNELQLTMIQPLQSLEETW